MRVGTSSQNDKNQTICNKNSTDHAESECRGFINFIKWVNVAWKLGEKYLTPPASIDVIRHHHLHFRATCEKSI